MRETRDKVFQLVAAGNGARDISEKLGLSTQRVYQIIGSKPLLPKRKVGRPANPANAGKRYPLGLRVTAEVKSRIQKNAEASGRSQSQEIEFQLERVFIRDDLINKIAEQVFKLIAERQP